jgi:hypothetical protein
VVTYEEIRWPEGKIPGGKGAAVYEPLPANFPATALR